MVSFWQSQEVTSGAVQVPPLAAGHKGLFFERLDAGALTWAGDGYVETHPYAPLATLGGLGQGEVSQPYLIGHARNRTLHTVLGQWNQRDPNATGMVVVHDAQLHGSAVAIGPSIVSLRAHVGDGPNVTQCVRSNAIGLSDPMGLYALQIGMLAASGIQAWMSASSTLGSQATIIRAGLGLHAMLDMYSLSLDFDVDYAMHMDLGDDDHSRAGWAGLLEMADIADSGGGSGPMLAAMRPDESGIMRDGNLRGVSRKVYDARKAQHERMRPSLWQKDARRNAHLYSDYQLRNMRAGKAPIGADGKPMQWHHNRPLMYGGRNVWGHYVPMTATEHEQRSREFHATRFDAGGWRHVPRPGAPAGPPSSSRGPTMPGRRG